jgi:hypothetical protein
MAPYLFNLTRKENDRRDIRPFEKERGRSLKKSIIMDKEGMEKHYFI